MSGFKEDEGIFEGERSSPQFDSFKPPRSEEGSLRDGVPQAGTGGSPAYPRA